jgi:hypothetical protein
MRYPGLKTWLSNAKLVPLLFGKNAEQIAEAAAEAATKVGVYGERS